MRAPLEPRWDLATRKPTRYDKGLVVEADIKYNPARRVALNNLAVRALAENWPCEVCRESFQSQEAAWVFRHEGKNLFVHRDCAVRQRAAWEGKEYLGLVIIMQQYRTRGMSKPKPNYNPEDDPHAELPPLAT